MTVWQNIFDKITVWKNDFLIKWPVIKNSVDEMPPKINVGSKIILRSFWTSLVTSWQNDHLSDKLL